MATYIVLMKFTERGASHIKDSPKRAAAFKTKAQGMGVQVKELYWTMGTFDGVLVLEATNDEAASAAMLKLAAEGNVVTHTLRAFNTSEMDAIVGKAGL